MYKDLVKKTMMLFVIIDDRRKQALLAMVGEVFISKEYKVVLLTNKTMKNSNLNNPLDLLLYQHYSENNKLCITDYLKISLRYSKDTGKTTSEITFNWLRKVTQTTQAQDQ